MPMVRRLVTRRGTAGIRALVLAIVMLLNLFVPTATAFADTGEATNETETVVNEETPSEDTEVDIDESTDSDEEEGEATVEEEQEEATDEEVEESEDEPEVAALSAVETDDDLPILNVNYSCHYRMSASEYAFVVNIVSSDDFELEAGSDHNYADPESYNSILPTAFELGIEDVTVEGWDGGSFTWMVADEEVLITLDESEVCDEVPTLLDVIDASEQTSLLSDLLRSDSSTCSLMLDVLDDTDENTTVFAPSNDAILSIVRAPSSSTPELSQLSGNPDELCALIASHVVPNATVASSDATAAGATLPALSNDLDGLFVQLVGSSVIVDGSKKVILADQFGSNGVMHVVNDVILPTSAGTIDTVATDNVAPALSGTIMTAHAYASDELAEPVGFCVVVRIDGVPYVADVTGNAWAIEQGVVMLNPSDPNTLFDVVVRVQADDGCESMAESESSDEAASGAIVRAGEQLVGLTMTRGVVSYQAEEPEEPADDGEVLGATDTEQSTPIVSYYSSGCGKGACGDVAQAEPDPYTTDSDGDGVVDAEDPAPNDPTITGLEDSTDTSTDDQTAESDDGSNNIFWWFVFGGGATILAYLYRQRTGGSVS